tara:strand:+ start:111784 stop:112452 length:669 start_codon:yes stop_codon:yes gene_type:complete
MRKLALLVTIIFISHTIHAQKIMKKIQLEEGSVSNIKYDDLNISTLFQVYDEKSAVHLIGDLYLRVDDNGKSIAEFYIDKSTKEYYTKIYKNYFLTFAIENGNRYLIIEQAEFDKTFALSNKGNSKIGNKDNSVEIEITDYEHEWGTNAPPSEDGNASYFDDVHYSLKAKVKNIVKDFSFYSSEIKGNLSIDLEGYCIIILSDIYKDSSCLIEMKIIKKETK